MKKFLFVIAFVIILSSCTKEQLASICSDEAQSIMSEYGLDGDFLMEEYIGARNSVYYNIKINSNQFETKSETEKNEILRKLNTLVNNTNNLSCNIRMVRIKSQEYVYESNYPNIAKYDVFIKPQPTSVIIPTKKVSSNSTSGNFSKSWINSETYGWGETITISKQGSAFTITTKFPDGSGETKYLSVKTVNGEMRLIETAGSLYGDYMVIKPDGYLAFYDNQGLIYSIPPK